MEFPMGHCKEQGEKPRKRCPITIDNPKMSYRIKLLEEARLDIKEIIEW